MEENKEIKLEPKEWVWWLRTHGTFDVDQVCDSREECIAKAQEAYDNLQGVFAGYDFDPPFLINVGSVERFSLREALKDSADSIVEYVLESMEDFSYGTEIENEYDGPEDKEGKQKFREEVADALLPIFEKYCNGSNPMRAMPLKGFYDLEKKCWAEKENEL